MANVSVTHYSSTGTNAAMAKAVADGASDSGAKTRVRIVVETAPLDAIATNPSSKAFFDKNGAEPIGCLGFRRRGQPILLLGDRGSRRTHTQ